MPAHLTTTAYASGFRNFIFAWLLLLAFGLPAMFVTQFYLDLPWSDAWSVALGFFMVPVFGIAAFYYFRGKSKGGPILLDGGPFPTRVFAVLLFFPGFIVFLGSLGEPNPLIALSSKISVVAIIILAISVFVARLQFRSNGIWIYHSFLPYDRVGSWRIKNNTLLFESNKRFLGIRPKGALPIAPEQRAEIEAILKHRCPDARHEDTGPEDGPEEGPVPSP